MFCAPYDIYIIDGAELKTVEQDIWENGAESRKLFAEHGSSQRIFTDRFYKFIVAGLVC